MYCESCKGNSYECTDLHTHFESFASQVVPTNSDISPQVLEKPISPLDFQTYANLLTRSSQLIKILRTLSLNLFMRKLLSTIDASAVPPLAKVAVLCQPKHMEQIKKYKPSKEDLSYAFYQLVKSSQTHFKPTSKYFLPIELKNGLTVASLRYEEKAAEEVLGCKFLPLISSSDKKLIKVLLNFAHCISAGPFSLHLNKSATIARFRQGCYGTVLAHARKILLPMISECVRCIRTSKAPPILH